MLRSERCRNDYVAFITETIDKGYAEKVPRKSLQIVPDKARRVPSKEAGENPSGV